VLDEEGETVTEEVVGAFLEGNTSQGIKETLITLLELTREGAVAVVGTRSHIYGDSDGRGEDCCHQEGWHLTEVTVLEATRNGGPARVELSGEGNLRTDVKSTGEETNLPSALEAAGEGF